MFLLFWKRNVIYSPFSHSQVYTFWRDCENYYLIQNLKSKSNSDFHCHIKEYALKSVEVKMCKAQSCEGKKKFAK